MLIFEISNNWVKALWGKSLLKDIQVGGVAAKPLESDSPEDLLEAITSLVDEKTFKKQKPLVLCVPRNQITLRNLKFPSTDEAELDNIVKLHLTQQVPYSKEEIIYNYVILHKDPSGFTRVLLGIMHRELLRKLFFVFEKLNLYPENVLCQYPIHPLLSTVFIPPHPLAHTYTWQNMPQVCTPNSPAFLWSISSHSCIQLSSTLPAFTQPQPSHCPHPALKCLYAGSF